MITAANKTIENTIREIKESQAEKEKTKVARQKLEEQQKKIIPEEEEEERLRRKIEKIKSRENRKSRNNPAGNRSGDTQAAPPTAIQKGDCVKLPNQATGEVMEIKDKKAIVALGNIQTTVPLGQLQKISANQAKKLGKPSVPASNWSGFRENLSQKRLLFKPEIDVRGMRGDEALQK